MTIGRIYKIVSPQTEKVYVGSTTLTLQQRLSGHQSYYKRFQSDGKCGYMSSFELLKYPDVSIEMIEEIEYEDKKQLRQRERYYIEFYKNIVNKNRPFTTNEEKNEEQKKYKTENKEILNAKAREKYDCNCGGKYTRSYKSNHYKSKRHINYITLNTTINIKDSDVNIINHENK